MDNKKQDIENKQEIQKGTEKSPLILKKINKIKKIITKLSIVLFLSIIFILALVFGSKVLVGKKSDLLKSVSDLKTRNQGVLEELKEVENKYNNSKKYLDIWENDFSERQKKLLTIKNDDIQKKIISIAENNNIWNINISFAPVINVGGIFEKKFITVRSAAITIAFSTLTDINVYNFLDDLKNNIDGFILVSGLNLKMSRKIDEAFLKDLKDGKKPTAISGVLKFTFYNLEEKLAN